MSASENHGRGASWRGGKRHIRRGTHLRHRLWCKAAPRGQRFSLPRSLEGYSVSSTARSSGECRFIDSQIVDNIDMIVSDQKKRSDYYNQALGVILRSRLQLEPAPTESSIEIAQLASLGVFPIEVSLRRMVDGQLEHVIGYRVEYAPPFRLSSPAGFPQLSSPTAGELAIAAYCIWATDPHDGRDVSERFLQTLPNRLPTEPIKVDLTYFGSIDEPNHAGSRICHP
jgi:hypothetical protein